MSLGYGTWAMVPLEKGVTTEGWGKWKGILEDKVRKEE